MNIRDSSAEHSQTIFTIFFCYILDVVAQHVPLLKCLVLFCSRFLFVCVCVSWVLLFRPNETATQPKLSALNWLTVGYMVDSKRFVVRRQLCVHATHLRQTQSVYSFRSFIRSTTAHGTLTQPNNWVKESTCYNCDAPNIIPYRNICVFDWNVDDAKRHNDECDVIKSTKKHQLELEHRDSNTQLCGNQCVLYQLWIRYSICITYIEMSLLICTLTHSHRGDWECEQMFVFAVNDSCIGSNWRFIINALVFKLENK